MYTLVALTVLYARFTAVHINKTNFAHLPYVNYEEMITLTRMVDFMFQISLGTHNVKLRHLIVINKDRTLHRGSPCVLQVFLLVRN